MIATNQATLTGTLAVSVATGDDALEVLADEWDTLLDDSDQRVSFLRPSWIRTWWRTYRPATSSLYLIACRDQVGRLVGLAPFYLRKQKTAGIPHVREIAFLGTGVFVQTSEYLDVIARRGYEDEVSDAVAVCLTSREDWDRLWLSEVPSQSIALTRIAREFGAGSQTAACNHSRYIDTTVDWQTFLASIRKSTRYDVVNKTRRLFEEHRCRFHRVETVDELPAAFDHMIRLHQARLQSKGEPGSFVLQGFESFVREAGLAAMAEGRARVWTLEIDGKVSAVRLAFTDNGVVHAFQGGFDPAFAKQSLGTVMVGLCVRDCIEDQSIREYDFMGGADRYKDWWTRLGRDTIQLTVTRAGLRSSVSNHLQKTKDVARSIVRRVVPVALRKAVHERIVQLRYHSRP